MGLRQRPPLLLQTTRFVEDGCSLAEHDGMACEPEDQIGPAPMRDHVDHLRGGAMTVTADQDVGAWPMVTQRGQKPDEDQGLFRTRGAWARAQGGRDQRVGGSFEHAKRQITIVLIVMIIEGKRLLAMGGSIGVIEIEYDGRRGLWVAGHTVIHQGGRETREVLAVSLMCKPRDCGRTCQGLLWGQGAPLAPQCAHRVMAETVGVMSVRIARGDVRDALG